MSHEVVIDLTLLSDYGLQHVLHVRRYRVQENWCSRNMDKFGLTSSQFLKL